MSDKELSKQLLESIQECAQLREENSILLKRSYLTTLEKEGLEERGAREMVEFLNTNGMWLGVDYWMQKFLEHKAAK